MRHRADLKKEFVYSFGKQRRSTNEVVSATIPLKRETFDIDPPADNNFAFGVRRRTTKGNIDFDKHLD